MSRWIAQTLSLRANIADFDARSLGTAHCRREFDAMGLLLAMQDQNVSTWRRVPHRRAPVRCRSSSAQRWRRISLHAVVVKAVAMFGRLIPEAAQRAAAASAVSACAPVALERCKAFETIHGIGRRLLREGTASACGLITMLTDAWVSALLRSQRPFRSRAFRYGRVLSAETAVTITGGFISGPRR